MLILLAVACACYGASSSVSYDMELTAVRRPADVQKRWGTYRITKADSGRFTYQDSLVNVLILPAGGEFLLEITNRSDYSIQLVWDEAAYVDPVGASSRVTAGDTKVIDMGRAQTPSVIPPGAHLRQYAIPNIYVTTSGLYGTQIRDFVEDGDDFSHLEGKDVRLLLPLRVQDVVNEYTFVFHLKDIAKPKEE